MVDLKEYTGLRRQGNKILKFGRICNDYDFPTEKEARGFERLYNSLAINTLKEIISNLKQSPNNSGLSQIELASRASHYFDMGMGTKDISNVLSETKRLYELSKNIKLLKKLDLI